VRVSWTDRLLTPTGLCRESRETGLRIENTVTIPAPANGTWKYVILQNIETQVDVSKRYYTSGEGDVDLFQIRIVFERSR
jgi:hypothetical protein